MYIFDDRAEKKIDKTSLVLTEEELLQLESYLKFFLKKSKDNGLHFHLSSDDYQKEITVCIYNPENLNALHDRVQRLIRYDE
jgi:hypothetical protein